MKNTKGFTLIELLAVIVILAVIALIATPIIMNVINDAKEGANGDAALGYAKSVETSIATQMIKCPGMVVGEIGIEDIKLTGCTVDGANVPTIDVNYKGTKPDAVTVSYTDKGELTGEATFGAKRFDVATGKLVK